MSKSGMETRSGFKKRSNSKSYLRGSTSVMPMQYATMDPTPEPLPGPTGMPCSLDQFMKSHTTR